MVFRMVVVTPALTMGRLVLPVLLAICSLATAAEPPSGVSPSSETTAVTPKAAPPCPWKDPIEAATLTLEQRTATFRQQLHPVWFDCAKSKGGTLALQFQFGRGSSWRAQKALPMTSSTIEASATHEQYCTDAFKAERVRTQVVGTGPMKAAGFTTPAVEVDCIRCDYSGDVATTTVRIEKNVKVEAAFEKTWHRCARPGSKLELRFYTGMTADEAEHAEKPRYVLRGLADRAQVKKQFSRKTLCRAGAKFVAWEWYGTSELKPLRSTQRTVEPLTCR